MSPLNNSSASNSPSKPSKPSNASIDRHLKVDGRDRRIRLPVPCAKTVFELQGKLGHRTAGETVEWMLKQAKPSIDAVLKTRQINVATLNVSHPSADGVMGYPYQMPAPLPMAPVSAPAPGMFSNTFNGVTFPAQDFAGYGATVSTPVSIQQWPPFGFQNEMQMPDSVWPRFS